MIYFMQGETGGPVKIGYTDDIVRRRKQLEAKYDCSLEVLLLVNGGRDRETQVHAQFAHLRFPRTELFRPEPELMEFISRPILVGADGDLVEAKGRDDQAVKLDRKLAGMAKLIATRQGVTTAELLSEMLRAPIERAYAKLVLDLEGRPESGRGAR